MAAPVAFCIFCDDVRQEVGNKNSLMGIYNGLIVFAHEQQFPVAMPKFAISIYVICDADKKPDSIAVRVLLPPNRTEVFSTTIQARDDLIYKGDDDAKKLILNAVIPFFGLTFPSPGYLEVMVKTDKREQRAGRLHITTVESGQQTPPPVPPLPLP